MNSPLNSPPLEQHILPIDDILDADMEINITAEPAVTDFILMSKTVTDVIMSEPKAVNCPQSDVVQYTDKHDIGHYINKIGKLNDSEKYDLLTNVWQPKSDFSFTTNPRVKRKFNYSWLLSYSWLVYSKLNDGAFCIYCTLFSSNAQVLGKMQQLCTTPFRDWKNAIKVFREHGEKQPHKWCLEDAASFKKAFTGRTGVQVQLSGILHEQIRKNRLVITSLIRILTTMSQQYIALRGRDEADPTAQFKSSEYYQESHQNPGNFLAVIKLAVELDCPVLKVHLSTCAKNATYLSKNIQNELL